MEPTTAISAGLSLYQAGGFALLLLAIVVIGAALMARFLMAMIRDLGARLNSVQDQQTGLLVGVIKESTAQMQRQTEAIEQQTEVLRARPCLVETGIHHRPTLPTT